MARLSDTRNRVLSLLSDCKPRSFNEIIKETGLSIKAVEGMLYRLWREGLILRTDKPFLRISLTTATMNLFGFRTLKHSE